jgi:hypothetical protein
LEWWSLCASTILMDRYHMLWRTQNPCRDFVSSDLSSYYSTIPHPFNCIVLCKWTSYSWFLVVFRNLTSMELSGSLSPFVTNLTALTNM